MHNGRDEVGWSWGGLIAGPIRDVYGGVPRGCEGLAGGGNTCDSQKKMPCRDFDGFLNGMVFRL
jgi:hypothetical protein